MVTKEPKQKGAGKPQAADSAAITTEAGAQGARSVTLLQKRRDKAVEAARVWERKLALAVTKLRYYNGRARALDRTIEARLAGVPPKARTVKKTRKIKLVE